MKNEKKNLRIERDKLNNQLKNMLIQGSWNQNINSNNNNNNGQTLGNKK